MGITGEKREERERVRQVKGRNDRVEEVVSKIKEARQLKRRLCTVPSIEEGRQADACSDSNLFAVGTPERGD
jgi:hypothetical protein